MTGWIAIRGRTGGGRVANGAGVWARTTRGTRSVRASMAHAGRVRVGVCETGDMVRSVRASIRVESEDGDTRDGETGKARAGVARRRQRPVVAPWKEGRDGKDGVGEGVKLTTDPIFRDLYLKLLVACLVSCLVESGREHWGWGERSSGFLGILDEEAKEQGKGFESLRIL